MMKCISIYKTNTRIFKPQKKDLSYKNLIILRYTQNRPSNVILGKNLCSKGVSLRGNGTTSEHLVKASTFYTASIISRSFKIF